LLIDLAISADGLPFRDLQRRALHDKSTNPQIDKSINQSTNQQIKK